uniref:Major facilitator superfamily (MFS) profile domain-containing protein n=1 Tax=Timema bartmani TaxID=61472 RepID=A0A7R9F946_9NEOP|nr:unnamed protein product [Timema bartmani]
MYDFTYSSATGGDGLGPMYFFWRRRRYMVAMLAFFGFFNVYALRVNFSVAIVAMTSNRTVKENGTIVEYMYFWFGISLSPVSKIAGRHQRMITSSLADAYYECPEEGERGPCLCREGKQCPLPPWFHRHCANLVIVYKNDLQRSLRNELIQFAAQVLNMKENYKDSFKVNALSAFTGPEFDWDSKTQGLLLSSFFFGYICTQILGGWLASRVGGNKVYGIGIAATSILTIVMPAVTYFPDHAVIPMIILVRVVEGLFEGVTYPCIHAVWARWAPPLERSRMASLAFAGSYVGTVVSLPICGILANELGWPSIFYVFDALEFNLKKAGFMSALPYLVMAIVLSFSGQLADYLITNKYLNTSQVRKLFTCSAFMGQAVFMLMTCFLLTPTGAVSCLTAAVGLGAFAWSGFSVNHLDIAPQHASVLMGLSNTMATLPGIISPSITGILVQNKTVDEWRVIFYMASSIYLFGALFYGAFSSGQIQPWAEHKNNNQDRTKIDEK